MSDAVPALRVLQVAHGWPPERIGGVELYVRALHTALRGRGVESTVFHAASQPEDRPHRRAVVGPHPAPKRYRETLVRRSIEARFRDWLARHQPDVVHLHHLTHLSLGLPRVAAECGAVVSMTLHDYWLPCARGQLVDRRLERCPGPATARCAACISGQLALGPGTAALGRLSARLPAGWRARAREALPTRADAMQAAARERQQLIAAAVARIARFSSPSRSLAARMAALGIGAGRTDVMDLPLVHPVEPSPPPGEGPVRFLFLGSLIPTKGPQLLLEAFARLPAGAATLHIAGPAPALDLDPDFARRITARARQLPGVSIEPAFPPGQVQRRLDDADVLVVPSLWEENSPLVVREATAAGLRICASERGGIGELDPDARLFEPSAPGALLMALAAELRAGRGRRPPIRWEQPAEHAGRLLSWYHRLVREHRRHR